MRASRAVWMKGTLSTGAAKRLQIVAAVVALCALPAVVYPQDLTTLLAIFLRNLHAGRIVIPVQTTFAALPSSTNGTIVYCSDCTEGADPATGGSTGAFVLRVNGRWVALDGGSGGGAPADAEYVVSEANGSLSAEVAPSAANQVPVSSSSTAAAWGTVPIAAGGTNQTTYAQGDLLYASAANTLSKLAKGTAGQFLKMNSGATVPEWGVQSMLVYAGAGDTSGYNPAAGSNFYFGVQMGLDPNTTDGGPSFTVPVTGTIAFCTVKQSTLGTNGINGENIVYRLRKNATTDSSIVATLDTDADNTEGTNSSLGFAVTAGDSVAVKGTPPAAWTTAPTIMFWSVVIRVDVP